MPFWSKLKWYSDEISDSELDDEKLVEDDDDRLVEEEDDESIDDDELWELRPSQFKKPLYEKSRGVESQSTEPLTALESTSIKSMVVAVIDDTWPKAIKL